MNTGQIQPRSDPCCGRCFHQVQLIHKFIFHSCVSICMHVHTCVCVCMGVVHVEAGGWCVHVYVCVGMCMHVCTCVGAVLVKARAWCEHVCVLCCMACLRMCGCCPCGSWSLVCACLCVCVCCVCMFACVWVLGTWKLAADFRSQPRCSPTSFIRQGLSMKLRAHRCD